MIHIFIINPFAGKKNFADDLRTKLENLKGIDYFVFNTRYKGYETELVKKISHIFEGEKLRFYCCGGSGTMRNMLNGFDNLEEAEVAFFPCGLTNDFLKTFGEEEQRFHHIEELIDGEVIKVDYIKSSCGVAMNTLSTGLDTNCCTKMEDFRFVQVFGENLPYTLALMYSMFVSKPFEYEVTLDGSSVSGKFAEIFVGNGCVLGGNLYFDNIACVNDGKAISRLISNRRGIMLMKDLVAATSKNVQKVRECMTCGECSKISIRRTDGQPFVINHDGELIFGVTECNAEIVHKGLHLVVPKGVTVR